MKDRSKSTRRFLGSCLTFLRQLFTAPEVDHGTTIMTFTIPTAVMQNINQLQERSGVADTSDLVRKAFATLAKLVDQELKGGSIELVEPNGVDRDKLELLRYLGGDDEFWKEE